MRILIVFVGVALLAAQYVGAGEYVCPLSAELSRVRLQFDGAVGSFSTPIRRVILAHSLLLLIRGYVAVIAGGN